MTEEEKYDRWERFAKRLCERSVCDSRESRKQTEKLKFYVDALRRNDEAKMGSEERPEHSDTEESPLRARQILDQAREELKHATKIAQRKLPA